MPILTELEKGFVIAYEGDGADNWPIEAEATYETGLGD